MIVTTNSRPEDTLRDSYIKFSELAHLLDRGKCKKVLLAADICFGGAFINRITRSTRGAGTDIYEQCSLYECLERTGNRTVRRVIAPGGKEPVYEGAPGCHSPLARNLVQALVNRGGTRGFVRFVDIAQAAEDAKPSGVATSFSDGDEPQGDFLFVPSSRLVDAGN